MLKSTRARYSMLLVAMALISMLHLTVTAPARADGPGVGAPWIVSVGDSYISGEAGRWAGNTKKSPSKIDALGARAYDDNPGHTTELIPGCHRSQSAEVYIGSGVNGENLACSGAQTSSFTSGKAFKPGLDFYNSGGHEGQALMLEKFAKTHNVRLVPLSIGGNNFNFKDIVTRCVLDFMIPLRLFPVYCSGSRAVTDQFTKANLAKQRHAIKTAILNVAKAMARAGYTTAQYTILVQDYPSPVPRGVGFRYSQKGFARQTTGGCGFWNKDADTVNTTMLPKIEGAVFEAASEAKLPNLTRMDLSSALNGRRLCEKGVGLLEEEGLTSWRGAGAVNKSEWVNEVRTVTAIFPPYQVQEDLHPNYWGQLALRNCLTQAYNAGTPKGGTCTMSGSGLNPAGEPKMTLK